MFKKLLAIAGALTAVAIVAESVSSAIKETEDEHIEDGKLVSVVKKSLKNVKNIFIRDYKVVEEKLSHILFYMRVIIGTYFRKESVNETA